MRVSFSESPGKKETAWDMDDRNDKGVRRMKTIWLSTMLAVAGLTGATTASAYSVDLVYSARDLNAALPDDDPAGVSSTISVVENAVISQVAVIVALDHTWVGDLIFTLTGPDGTTITLANQPGTTDPDLDAGDSANASVDYPIVFGDHSPWAAENLGGGACTGTDSVIGLDCARWVRPDDALSATFFGTSTLGDWTLNVSDNTGLDLGTLDGWLIAFQYEVVPVPAGIWLFASGLFLLVARRRR
jgi:subtilisin-like proprotein convertase family protein